MLTLMPRKMRPAVSQADTVPAPVGGWNARDPLAAMKPEEAVYLVNWFPTPTSVDLRKGAVNWATGMTGNIESLMSYSTPAGTQRLFAAANNNIFNVTSAGAVGAAETTGTLTANRWQHINVTTSGGSFLYCVNGADKPLLYNGTTWTQIDGVSSPAITGVTTTNLIHITLHKNRVWFVEKATLKAWYLPTQSVGGAAASFDISAQCRRGGYLMALGSWTIDAGDGVDDHLVFVTSEGEVLVYKGTDPASIATWALVGRWDMGYPIGRRCFQKFGGDLLLITREGVFPMSSGLLSARVNPRVAVTNKIEFAMSTAATQYGSNYGWELKHYPEGDMLILNVPLSSSQSEQYVMNTITGAWCKFTAWNAVCWEVHNGELYYGTSTKVVKAWNGLDDMGSNIAADAKSSFNYFKTRGQKRFTLARPIIIANQLPPIAIGLNFDFSDLEPVGVISGAASTAGTWDTSLWDVGVWGGDPTVFKGWQGVRGVGFCAATRLAFEGKNYEVSWVSTDYVYEQGGIL